MEASEAREGEGRFGLAAVYIDGSTEHRRVCCWSMDATGSRSGVWAVEPEKRPMWFASVSSKDEVLVATLSMNRLAECWW